MAPVIRLFPFCLSEVSEKLKKPTPAPFESLGIATAALERSMLF